MEIGSKWNLVEWMVDSFRVFRKGLCETQQAPPERHLRQRDTQAEVDGTLLGRRTTRLRHPRHPQRCQVLDRSVDEARWEEGWPHDRKLSRDVPG